MQDIGDRDWALQRLNLWRSAREPEALGQLLKWQRDRAYATALRILGNSADAEDAVQQACIKLLSRTHGFDTLEEFKVTVYRAVVQCALDMARANRVRAKLEKAMSPIERHTPVPQLAAEQAEALRLIWQELHSMPEESRAMVVLCYQEGLSVSDAAEVLAVPRETLRDRLASSMADLRQKLSQRGVMFSLLMIAGLLQHGSSEAAPAGLREALDVALPGPPCSDVPVAKAQPPAAEFNSASAPSSSPGFPRAIGLGMAASLLVGAVIWFALDAATAPSHEKAPATTAAQSQHNPAAGKVAAASPAPAAPPAQTAASPVPAQAAPSSLGRPARVSGAPVQAALANPKAAARAANTQAAEKDEPIALADVPAAVRATAQKALAGVVLKSAERITGNKKVLYYEIKGEAAGKVFDIVVREDGTLLQLNPDDDNEDDAAKVKPVLPPAPPKAEF